MANAVSDLLGEPIEPRDRRRRLHPVQRERPERVSELRHRRGCLDALADDVPDHEPELPVRQPDGVEPVAADVDAGGSRKVASGELNAFDARQRRGKDAALKRLGDRLLGLEEARAVERLCGLAGEGLDESPVLCREPVRLRPGEDEQPVRAPPGDQRDVEERLVLGELHHLVHVGDRLAHVVEARVERRHAPLHGSVPRSRLVE